MWFKKLYINQKCQHLATAKTYYKNLTAAGCFKSQKIILDFLHSLNQKDQVIFVTCCQNLPLMSHNVNNK